MDPRLTEALAIWGSSVSTVALVWQIFQWVKSNPRIAVNAHMVEGHSTDVDDSISFELRNRGRQPTTIEEIMFVAHSSWFARLTRYPDLIENVWVGNESTMKLPVILEPGEVWKGSCPLEARHERGGLSDHKTRRERFAAGKLFYRVRCAHTDSLISGTVKPENFFERM